MVACIDFFEMSEICRPKFIVRHSTVVDQNKIGQSVTLDSFTIQKFVCVSDYNLI
jgi:hypothetical protein